MLAQNINKAVHKSFESGKDSFGSFGLFFFSLQSNSNLQANKASEGMNN